MMLTSNNTDEQDEEDLWALLSFTFIWTLRTPNDMALQLPDLPVSHTLWIWTCCLCFPVLQGNPPLPVPLSYSGVSSRLRCHFFQESFSTQRLDTAPSKWSQHRCLTPFCDIVTCYAMIASLFGSTVLPKGGPLEGCRHYLLCAFPSS